MCLGGGNNNQPQPAAVIERQAYKQPAPFDSFSDPAAAEARRRMIAGVVTGAQGVTGPASTTKGVVKNQALGGGAAPDPLGGGSSTSPGAGVGAVAGAVTAPVTATPPLSQIISTVASRSKARILAGKGAYA